MNSNHGELLVQGPNAPLETARREEQGGVLAIIAHAVSTPGFDVEKLERLIALKERTEDQERRNAFAAAMSRLQAKLPQIEKTGRIMSGTSVRSTYAKLEDLDAQIRPYLAEEGFAFSYDTQPGNGQDIRIVGKLSHTEGHFELKQIDLPIDDGGAKSKVQMRGSTLTYGIRQLLKMHLNLVMKEEDDDGTGEWNKAITEDQALTIQDLMEEVKGNPQTFLKMYGISQLRELRAKQYGAAVAALQAKRRA